jgi:hypothetical protein
VITCVVLGIVDATINNGIFKPANHAWLFPDEEYRRSDSPMSWSETTGNDPANRVARTSSSLSTPLGARYPPFYRESRNQHPGAAFRYEGGLSISGTWVKGPAHSCFAVSSRKPCGRRGRRT